MKKVLSIVLALVLVLSLSVAVFADEVLYSEKTAFWSAGNWNEYDLENADGNFFELLSTPGAVLAITRDKESTVSFADGSYEKFNLLDSWWSGKYPNPQDAECGWIQLGTRGHTSADESSILVDCLSDDGITVMWDANAIYEILAAADVFGKGGPHLISNCGTDGAYNIINVSIIVPDAPIVPETPAEPEAPAEVEPVVETAPEAPKAETKTEAPAKTGVVMAVLPMAMAACAVVLSKKR